jgi:MFS family permease
LGDRIGRRKVMMYALVFYCFFTLIAASAPSYEVFVSAHPRRVGHRRGERDHRALPL